MRHSLRRLAQTGQPGLLEVLSESCCKIIASAQVRLPGVFLFQVSWRLQRVSVSLKNHQLTASTLRISTLFSRQSHISYFVWHFTYRWDSTTCTMRVVMKPGVVGMVRIEMVLECTR